MSKLKSDKNRQIALSLDLYDKASFEVFIYDDKLVNWLTNLKGSLLK